MQKMILIGNICQDLSLEATASGNQMLRFGVAVKRDYQRGDGERTADFFDAVCWNKVAENVARFCKKGDKIYLEGRIETRSYEDNNGIKRKAIDFIVDKTEFLGIKKEEIEEAEETETRSARRSRPTLTDMSDDSDIPF